MLDRILQQASHALPKPYNNQPLPSIRAPGALVGLGNGGATCYMNATFQQLFMQPTVRHLTLSAPPVPADERNDSVFHHVQTMFAHLAAGVEPWYEPCGFWRAFKDYEGRPVNIREHQDAYEFFTRLQESLDDHLRAVGSPPAIQAALGGTFAQVITVAGRPELRSERDEDFYQISLDVRGKRGLEESLESYVAVELMDGQNQWLCEELGQKVDAEKRTLIRNLPHTLMLHLKRFEWDYETYSRWKVKDRFEFPIELNMKPYTHEGAAGGGGGLEGTIAQSRPEAYYRYELRGIVVHSGTAFAGHYYSYAKDRDCNGGWYCFDDTTVDPWDPSSIDIDCFGGKFIPEGSNQEFDRPHSAYMLVYERVEAVDDHVEKEEEDQGTKQGLAVAMAAGQKRTEKGECGVDDTNVGAMTSEIREAAAAAALPGVRDAIVCADVSTLSDLLKHNLRELATLHILHSDLLAFFTSIASHSRIVFGPMRPRKVARAVGITSPSIGGAGGGSGGPSLVVANNTSAGPRSPLRDLASVRSGDCESLGVQAAILCLSYYCRIVARAWEDMSHEMASKRQRSLMASLSFIVSRQEGATAILQYAGGPETAPHFSQALGSQVFEVREFSRKWIVQSASTIAEALPPEAAEAFVKPVFDHLMDVVTEDIGTLGRARLVWPWEDVLAAVSELANAHMGHVFGRMAAVHLNSICDIGRPIIIMWSRLNMDERYSYDFGHSYLRLLSVAMLHYWPGLHACRRPSGCPNPFCVPPGPHGSHPVLPVEAWDFIFSAVDGVMLPSCINSDIVAQFLCWLLWNNEFGYTALVKALLVHVSNKVVRGKDLASECLYLAKVMSLQDEFLWTRYE